MVGVEERRTERRDVEHAMGDLGGVEEAYQEVARRLGILPESGPQDLHGPKSVN